MLSFCITARTDDVLAQEARYDGSLGKVKLNQGIVGVHVYKFVEVDGCDSKVNDAKVFVLMSYHHLYNITPSYSCF